MQNELLHRMKIWMVGVLIAGTLVAQAQTTEPAWKDQSESDIGLAAQDEKDPVRQLELLKKWEQQYPNSDFRGSRTVMTAFALLNIIGGAFSKTDEPSLDAGQKAAQQLLDHFSTYFDPAVKPAAKSDEQWAGIKKIAELQAHALLAQVAAIKKDDATAETEYKRVLGIDPTQAGTSYQLGSAILRQMIKSKDANPARYSEALYDLARSLAVTGPNELPAPGRAAVEKSLKTNYTHYHGSTDGIDDLLKQAANSALPPTDFHLPSLVDIDEAKQKDHAAWALKHPDLDFWETIRNALETQGDAFFAASLSGVELPPPASETYKGPAMFSGTVVSVRSPKQILVNVETAAGDALLKFDDDIKGDIPAGTAIRFKGVVDSYTKDPSYMLTFNIQDPKTDVAGLPDGVTFGHAPKAQIRKPAGK